MGHFWVKIFKNEEFHKICSVKFSKILCDNTHGSENDFNYFVRTTLIISEENFFGCLGIK